MSPAPLDTMSLYSTFTEHPNAPPTVVFPNNGMQILAQLVHLIGIALNPSSNFYSTELTHVP